MHGINVQPFYYPALKHMFRFDELTGATILTDDVGRVSLKVDSAGTATNNGDGTLTLSNTASYFGGTWAVPNGKHVVMMYSGKPKGTAGAAQVFFGMVSGSSPSGNGCQINCTDGQTSKIVSDGVITNALTNSWGISTQYQKTTYVLSAEYGTEGRIYGIADTDHPTYTSVSSANPRSLVGKISPTTIPNSGKVELEAGPAMLTIWHFNTMPSASELQLACEHQHNVSMTAGAGSIYRKLPYTGWWGRS